MLLNRGLLGMDATRYTVLQDAFMSFAGDHFTAVGSGRKAGIPVSGLDWDRALVLAENLARTRGGRSALSFLDEALIVRCIADRAERQIVSRHLLLPSLGRISRMILRLMGFQDMTTAFDADDFVAAFLTFAAQPLRILVVAEDPVQARGLADRLKSHAPWHDILTSHPACGCDVMIVSAADNRRSREIAAKSTCAANLAIHAGRLY